MKTVGIVLARLVSLVLLLGGGYVVYDTIRTKRSGKSKARKTAPFGDTHYESVKQTFPENASDADTPQMIRERQEIALDKQT